MERRGEERREERRGESILYGWPQRMYRTQDPVMLEFVYSPGSLVQKNPPWQF